jgi:hypothetical protein
VPPPPIAEASVLDSVTPTATFSTKRIQEKSQAGDVLQRVNKPTPPKRRAGH